MDDTRRVIRQALADVKVVDPHCHLRPSKPSADNLADIVLYHHVWIELVSSGMNRYEVTRAGLPHEMVDPEMPPIERVRLALPYLPNIQNTVSGMFLRWILQDLYGLPELTEANLEAAAGHAQRRAEDPAWQEEVLRDRCRIESSITMEAGTPYGPAMLKGREWLPTNIVDGKRTPQQVLAAMETTFGREIRDADDYREFMGTVIRGLPLNEFRCMTLWTPPSINHILAREESVTQVIRDAREGRLIGPDEAGGFAYFAVRCLLDELRKTDMRVIQWMAGAEVLLPHRSVVQWDGAWSGTLGRIANEYEEFAFNLTTAADAHLQDLAILAKHVPNISVAGYWWHTFYPHYIRKSLETRLDAVPANKIVGFFSDAYHCEWCYPKLKLVKQILEDILVERVDRGWYSLELACSLVTRLLYTNPKAIYHL